MAAILRLNRWTPRKNKDTEKEKKPTELNSKDYEAIRKLVKYNDKPIQNIK